MKRDRNAKIVATLGPASTSPEEVDALFRLGADVFRLNFSHGTHEEHKERYTAIRGVEDKYRRPIAVMGDIQGPKLRIGTFAEKRIHLAPGASFRFDLNPDAGDDQRVFLPHPEIFQALEVGTDLLLDDGRLRMRVEEAGEEHAVTRVITGGTLSDHKGVNVPNAVLPLSPITEKDRRDLAFALDMGVDWVALSFVQRPEDVAEARKLVQGRAGILAKLEKPQAIEHLEEIIQLSDAIMVARGDLGVEVPPETVPILQKRIIHACHQAGKPVIVATQMLDSMVHAPVPTRAEASDVATAIFDGADAVMLSAETAAGDYPTEAVGMMNRIIHRIEGDELSRTSTEAGRQLPEHTSADAICAAARQVAGTVDAKAIVAYTSSGFSARRLARERPGVPILGLTAEPGVARRMAMVWGLHSTMCAQAENFADMVKKAQGVSMNEGFARPGDKLVIVAGVPFGTAGTTNILRIAVVEGKEGGQ